MTAPRVAVVGLGYLGSRHADKLQTLADAGRCALGMGVDPDEGARARAAERGLRAVPTLGDVEDELDAVVIAAPTVHHGSLVTEALARGWDVLVEKPLAATAAEAAPLVADARARGRILQVGHVERYNPALAAALRIADRPRYVVAERLGPFTGRSAGDDVIVDLMIHDLDLVGSLIDAEVTEVRAVGVPVLTGAVDMAAVRLEFADGAVAQLSAGRASLDPVRKLRLFTLQRYLSIDCLAGEVKCVRRLPPEGDAPWPTIAAEPVAVEPGDALLAQARDFLRCVRERAAPPADGRAGLRALELAERIRGALRVPLKA